MDSNMKIVILTSNSLRHKFLANTLSSYCDDALIISECKPQNLSFNDSKELTEIENHFLLRDETEKSFFPNDNYFIPKTLPILYKEVNSEYIYEIIKSFKPDAMFVFGSSIIREPLISLLPPGHIINLHLGLSPYYRGSGTNFWPFVNSELEYLGSTILHLDAGIDTGDILFQKEVTFSDEENTFEKTYNRLKYEIEILFMEDVLRKIYQKIKF